MSGWQVDKIDCWQINKAMRKMHYRTENTSLKILWFGPIFFEPQAGISLA